MVGDAGAPGVVVRPRHEVEALAAGAHGDGAEEDGVPGAEARGHEKPVLARLPKECPITINEHRVTGVAKLS